MTTIGSNALHVLIVHFNTPELTSQLAKDIPQRTPHGRKVFVHILDNNSTDANLDALRHAISGRRNITLDESSVNLGFGHGVNRLAERASIHGSDVIWLLNSDTRLDSNCLDVLENELDLGAFDVVSPLIYSGDTTRGDVKIWYCGGIFCMPEVRLVVSLHGRRLMEAPQCSFETEFITGAAPMMRAQTFRAVGGFPNDYFLYWEDAYFSWKARRLGLRLGVVPRARLWHAVGASSGSGLSRTFYYWFARNRFKFATDAGIPLIKLVLGRGGIETFRNIGRALVAEESGRISKFRLAVRGTMHGLFRKSLPRFPARSIEQRSVVKYSERPRRI